MTSITLGLLIVFALEGTSVAQTTQHTLSPSADIMLGAVGLILALVIGRGPNKRISERRARRKQAKMGKPPPMVPGRRSASRRSSASATSKVSVFARTAASSAG